MHLGPIARSHRTNRIQLAVLRDPLNYRYFRFPLKMHINETRSSAIAEGPRDASCQLKSCQLPRNSAETTYTTSPDQIDGMKLEI